MKKLSFFHTPFLSLKNGSTLLRESSNAPQGCAEKDCNMELNRIVYSK